jgi:putative peptidoglycan lipid II flippase
LRNVELLTWSQRRSFGALVVLAGLGQLTVLVYEIAVTRHFGTGRDADLLALAFMISYALGNEVSGWIGVLFIPRYLEAKKQGGPELAGRFFSFGLLATGIVAGTLSLLTVGLAPLLGLLAAEHAGGAWLLRLFSPLIVLLPLTAVLSNALQADGRFVLAALRPIWWYGVASVAVISAADMAGTAVVPIGMAMGLLGHGMSLALLAPKFRVDLKDVGRPPIEGLARVLAPLAVMSVANYGQVLVERWIAGRLQAGSLSAVTYAFRLVNGPVTLIALSAATVLFPVLSAKALGEDPRDAGRLLTQASRTGVLLSVPCAVLIMICAHPLVTLLFERGAFTAESSATTGTAVFYYAPGIIGQTMVLLLIRGYWATGFVKRLAAIQVGAAILGALSMPAFASALGLAGLPLAISLTALVQAGALLLGLEKQVPGFSVRSIARSATWATAVGLCGGTAAAVGSRALGTEALTQLLWGGLAGSATYVVMLWRLAPEEFANITRVFVQRRRSG